MIIKPGGSRPTNVSFRDLRIEEACFLHSGATVAADLARFKVQGIAVATADFDYLPKDLRMSWTRFLWLFVNVI